MPAKVKPTKKVTIKFGLCPFCHATIMRQDQQRRPLREATYREFWVLLSDGSKMKVAICADCREVLDETMIEALMVEHRTFWKKGIIKAFNEQLRTTKRRKAEQVAYYNQISSVRFGVRERDLD